MKKILYDLHEYNLKQFETILEDKKKDEKKDGKIYTNNEYIFKWIHANAKKFRKKFEKEYCKKHKIKK